MSVLNEGRRLEPGLSRNRPHGNLRVLRLAVLLLFGILVVRLVDMQIVNGADYARRARENHIITTNVLPTRGLIYDRNGEPLVVNTGVFTATVTPLFLPADPDERYRVYLQLERIVGVPALEIQARVDEAIANDAGDLAVPIKKYLTREEALMLDEASVDMPGVDLAVTPGREYPGGEAFSHLLGYVGPQSPEEWRVLRERGYAFNEPVGKSGVEAEYEATLRGQAGYRQLEVDAQGEPVNTLDSLAPEPGGNLRLAIDSGLQAYVTQLLEERLVDPNGEDARVAAAVVMNPKTGELYAIASVPTYDNNIFSQPELYEAEFKRLLEDPRNPLLNQALSPVAPGSTFKLITAAAALQEGNITPATGRNVTSTIWEYVGEDGQPYYFRDWRAHGYLDLEGAIAWSSNIYFYMASCGIPDEGIRGLGKDIEQSAVTLGYYARAFGLGQRTGIDLVGGEAAGVIPNPEWRRRVVGDDWYLANTCFMGIGQGDVTATPLQIALMTAAVANGGYLLRPHVVNEILDAEGNILERVEPEWTRVPVDAEHLAVIRRGMRTSVIEGAAANASVPGYEVAGKTGTAEFTLPDGTVKNHAWFTGFAPYSDPEVVVTVYFDVGWGGDKAAPVAGQILAYFRENVQR
ncbi:MAG: penicillin-binding protein 2 [Dehalococcoidia bacterium]